MLAGALDHVGGMELQALTLARSLRSMGVQVTFLAQQGDFSVLAENDQAFISTLPDNPEWLPGPVSVLVHMYRSLAFLFRHRLEFDIIHAHSLENGMTAALAGILLGKPTLTKVASAGPRGEIARHRRSQLYRLRLFLLNRLDRIVAITPEIYHELCLFGCKHNSLVLIPNGVDAESFYPLREDTPRTLAADRGLGAVCVARFVPKKHHFLLLKAWKAVVAQLPTAQLWLVGDGQLRQQVESLIKEYAMGDSIHLVGEKKHDEVVPFLQRANLFILPSESEGLSNSILEALSCGLPVITTDTIGTRSIIRDRETGRLVPESASDQALGKIIIELFSQQSLLTTMGKAARADVQSRFSIHKIATTYIGLYETLLSNGKNVKKTMV